MGDIILICILGIAAALALYTCLRKKEGGCPGCSGGACCGCGRSCCGKPHDARKAKD